MGGGTIPETSVKFVRNAFKASPHICEICLEHISAEYNPGKFSATLRDAL